MNFDTVLENRRSIRKYAKAPIEKETIEELVKAASLAPSWKNSQSRRYYAAYSPEAVNYVRNEVLAEMNRTKTENASCYIISCAKKKQSGLGTEDEYANEIEEGWSLYDLGLADENLLLKGYEMGFGTLVMGIRDSSKIREYFKVPEDEIIMSVIAIGKPAIEPVIPKRKDLDEILKIC